MENELSKNIVEDGQLVRAVYYYLGETFEAIKGKTLNYEQRYDTLQDFLEDVKAAADSLLNSVNEE